MSTTMRSGSASARAGGHWTGEIEDELRRFAVVSEAGGHRDRRRVLGARRRSPGERRNGQGEGQQHVAKEHRSSAVSAPFLAH